MEYIKKITFSIATLTLVFGLQAINAQDIDTNRMNRDINIMENILQEMFKTQMEGTHDNLRVHSIGSYHFGQNDIRGTYLPEYGVIFNITSGRQPLVLFENDDNSFSYSFQYRDDKEGEKVTEESIKNRIVEFLRDYGSTLGQLSGDDRVMVTYSPGTQKNPELAYFRSSDKNEKMNQQLPTISVVATTSDLKAYRSGDLNEEQFRNRLEISTATGNSKKQMDLKVMAKVFETAFDESDEKSFRVSGSVDYLKLDNFGALFSFDAQYSSNAFEIIDRIRAIEVLNGETADGKTLKEDEGKSTHVEVRSWTDSAKATKLAKQQEQSKAEAVKAYSQFVSDLKEYLVDYGRTLHSVEPNQHILVSVAVHSRYEEIPERIDLQVQKSTLTAVDKGNMSREQVIDQIKVREY